MSKKLNIEPRIRRINLYIQDIEKGLLQIPPFQRSKIWGNKQRKDLFDSLKNGYPIGSMLLWKPNKDITFKMESNKIGPYSIEFENKSEFFYILDGFQRLSTIFGCLIDPEKTELRIDQDEWKKDFAICYDLKEEEFFIPRSTMTLTACQIPVYNFINTRATYLLEKNLHHGNGYTDTEIECYMDRYEVLGSTLIDYQLSSTEINGGSLEDAVEIFSRINSKGSPISLDWMISALTYDKDSEGFKLSDLIDELVENLRIYNFHTIKREQLFQCILNSFGKAHFDQGSAKNTQPIELLIQRNDFVPIVQKTIANIEQAVKFLFEELLVLESKLLPYNNQLVFITDFFNQIEKPNENQLKKLKKWFWMTTYANYFTLYSLSKQRAAYHQFQQFLKDENQDPLYNDKPDSPFEVIEFPTWLTMGSVRAKALILFMLNYSQDFKKVDSNTVEGFKLHYLFYDKKDSKGHFLPESAIPILIESEKLIDKKSKDMSSILNSEQSYDNYFITDEIKEKYFKKEENYKDTTLVLRKVLIVQSENTFIKKLGLL